VAAAEVLVTEQLLPVVQAAVALVLLLLHQHLVLLAELSILEAGVVVREH
jgi:hypothetical protein